jgi:hypothetical protein
MGTHVFWPHTCVHHFCLLGRVHASSLDYLHGNLPKTLIIFTLNGLSGFLEYFGLNFYQLLLKSAASPPDLLPDSLKQLFLFFSLQRHLILLP